MIAITLRRRKSLSALVLLALLVTGLPVRGQSGGVPVAVAPVEREAIINQVRLSGTVVSPRTARLSATEAGRVEALTVDIGDRVSAGDVLVRLDQELARQAVAQADAAVAEAEADLTDAQREVRVGRRLVERDNLAANELERRQAQADMAAAVLDRRKAEAAAARERLARRRVEAPFDGVVARKVTELGEWLSPGDTVVELVATDALRVDIPVPQTYYPQLDSAVPITLRFDALPDQAFAARRIALVPVSDPTARTFTLRVAPRRDDLPLTPGMSAQAVLKLATGTRGLVVPRDAVLRTPDGRTSVWVLTADDQGRLSVSERQVTLGRAFDGRVHIRRGLDDGDRVVVRGNEALREGQRVQLADPES